MGVDREKADDRVSNAAGPSSNKLVGVASRRLGVGLAKAICADVAQVWLAVGMRRSVNGCDDVQSGLEGDPKKLEAPLLRDLMHTTQKLTRRGNKENQRRVDWGCLPLLLLEQSPLSVSARRASLRPTVPCQSKITAAPNHKQLAHHRMQFSPRGKYQDDRRPCRLAPIRAQALNVQYLPVYD